MYANNTTGERSCFLSNVNGQNDVDVDLDQDGKYFVPAWSVGIIQNCNKEIYNSAKVKEIDFIFSFLPSQLPYEVV